VRTLSRHARKRKANQSCRLKGIRARVAQCSGMTPERSYAGTRAIWE
jgi:hypothetical protein